jgi:bacterioferritin
MLTDTKTGLDSVPTGFAADRNGLIKLLNEALAAKLACVLRFERHHFIASGLNAKHVAKEFLYYAKEEREQALLLAKRIVQIGGEPEFSPDGLVDQGHAGYIEGVTLLGMIEENLVAERASIERYLRIITYLGGQDTTTLRLIEGILAMEEEHGDDLSRLVRELAA